MPKLTVRTIEAAKPRDREYKLTADRGLYLRVATDGTKTWLVRFVVDGRQRQVTLPKPYGASGESSMSLAEATAENARIQALARAGVDFREKEAAERKAALAAQQLAQARDLPFESLFEAWLKDGVVRKDGNAELRRAFTKDVLPLIGKVLVRQLDEHHLRKVLRAQVSRGVNRMAVRTYHDLVQLFRWAEKRQPWRGLLADGNPAELIEIGKIVAPHYDLTAERSRVLSADEIRELWIKLNAMPATSDGATATASSAASRPIRRETQLALWICLSTLSRIGELLMARWEHIDFQTATWEIPIENVKGARGKKQAHRVYLSAFAKRQFETLRELTGDSPYCFPSRDGKTHVDLKTISKQVGDRQTRFKTRSKSLAHRRNDDSLVLGGGSRGEWTPHDLRRTGATMMQLLRISPDVIDRCQNHVMGGPRTRRHYLHHDYQAENREAWRLLGQRLERILLTADGSPSPAASLGP